MNAAQLIGPRSLTPKLACFVRISYTAGNWTYRQFTDGSEIVYSPGFDPIEVQSSTYDNLPEAALRAIHEALSIYMAAIDESKLSTTN